MTGRPSCFRFSFPVCCFLLCFLRCFLGGGGLRFCSCLVLFPVCLPRSARSAVFGPPSSLLPRFPCLPPVRPLPSVFCARETFTAATYKGKVEARTPVRNPRMRTPQGRKPCILEPGRPAGHANIFQKIIHFFGGRPPPGSSWGPACDPADLLGSRGGGPRRLHCFGIELRRPFSAFKF